MKIFIGFLSSGCFSWPEVHPMEQKGSRNVLIPLKPVSFAMDVPGDPWPLGMSFASAQSCSWSTLPTLEWFPHGFPVGISGENNSQFCLHHRYLVVLTPIYWTGRAGMWSAAAARIPPLSPHWKSGISGLGCCLDARLGSSLQDSNANRVLEENPAPGDTCASLGATSGGAQLPSSS